MKLDIAYSWGEFFRLALESIALNLFATFVVWATWNYIAPIYLVTFLPQVWMHLPFLDVLIAIVLLSTLREC